MGLLDSIEKPEPEKKNYRFFTGDNSDIEGLLNDFVQPKEHMPEPTPPPEPEMEPEPEPEEFESAAEKRRKAQRNAKFVANTIDTLMAGTLSFVAMDENSEPYRADDQDKEELENAWAELLKDAKGNIPPWLQVVVSSIIIYGLKTKTAIENRRLKIKIKEQQDEISNLETELKKEKLKKQINNETGLVDHTGRPVLSAEQIPSTGINQQRFPNRSEIKTPYNTEAK